MKALNLMKLALCMIVLFAMLSLPAYAQESELEKIEIIPISGTFSYTWELLHMVETDFFILQHAREDEIWSGDLEGTGEAEYRLEFWNSPPVMRTSFMIEFTGTLLDEYEGTLTIILTGPDLHNPLIVGATSPWPYSVVGEWKIVSGTGELSNLHGYGMWWGPANAANDPDHSVPDIAWQGEVMFMEAPSD